MDSDELLQKCNALLYENHLLKTEVDRLKKLLEANGFSFQHFEKSNSSGRIDKFSSTDKKMDLYLSLFRGRTDVYAKRWQNKAGISGYSPVCLNEWKNNICGKSHGKCSSCAYKLYQPFGNNVIEDHLTGNIIAGIYPLISDETCYFLAIDFDGPGWNSDVLAVRQSCKELSIPITIERSRSGDGAHAWFFFQEKIPATLARNFGTKLLTFTMSHYHGIKFTSYDRLFPNQDTLPKGGFGNLIALPLQKEARKMNNSEFIDETFTAYPDQWYYLSNIQKISIDDVNLFISKFNLPDELGILQSFDESSLKPWETSKKPQLKVSDFPPLLTVVESNMIYVRKNGISPRGINALKRLAAFKNPDFFKTQAMRLSTYGKPRIISCSEESEEFIHLPRGCKVDLLVLLTSLKIELTLTDLTIPGRPIDVTFNGTLREEQSNALEHLLESKTGILCGTTAFGKTIVAINLIAEVKTTTLIIVDKVSLLTQWKKKLEQFLTFNDDKPDSQISKDKTDRNSAPIGIVGNSKNSTKGIIDIALIQSLSRMEELKEFIQIYGMIIVDECHHVSSFSFEKVLKAAPARYVYGLTATPFRKDGHHPIIFMQCGKISFRDDAKVQAANRPFQHFIIPRFTRFAFPQSDNASDLSISRIYSEILIDEFRNQIIADDVISCYKEGRNCCIITERTAHIELLIKKLIPEIPDIITLTGKLKASELKEAIKTIENQPQHKPLTLIATGKFIGEGFDVPRLDTLFLTMPISWKGTLQQYAGRLHRLYDGKQEVRIYDYIDIHIPVLEKMYHRRLNGYGSIGYKIKPLSGSFDQPDIIYDKSSFLPVYTNDLLNAQKEIFIISPFVSRRRVCMILPQLQSAILKNISVTVITRPIIDFKDTDMKKIAEVHHLIRSAGITLQFKSNIHQKFAIIDQKIVWYGSINLLSFGSAEESIMRLNSGMIAGELMKSFKNR
jgi:superfamily II DNA or RNA helicase